MPTTTRAKIRIILRPNREKRRDSLQRCLSTGCSSPTYLMNPTASTQKHFSSDTPRSWSFWGMSLSLGLRSTSNPSTSTQSSSWRPSYFTRRHLQTISLAAWIRRRRCRMKSREALTTASNSKWCKPDCINWTEAWWGNRLLCRCFSIASTPASRCPPFTRLLLITDLGCCRSSASQVVDKLSSPKRARKCRKM